MANDYPPLTAIFFQGDSYNRAISPAWATWFNTIAKNITNANVAGAENLGEGVGIFKQKSLATLQFYSLSSGNSILDLSLNGSNVVQFTVDEAAINHDNLSGFVANEHIDWTNAVSNFLTTGTVGGGAATFTSLNTHTIPGSTGTLALISDIPAAASQAEMEAASSTSVSVTPGRTKYHPGVAKAWVIFSASSTIDASYNVSSITDNGVGDFTINFTTAFSSGNYGVSCMTGADTNAAQNARVMATGATPTTSAFRIIVGYVDSSGLIVLNDNGFISCSFFGDQS